MYICFRVKFSTGKSMKTCIILLAALILSQFYGTTLSAKTLLSPELTTAGAGWVSLSGIDIYLTNFEDLFAGGSNTITGKSISDEKKFSILIFDFRTTHIDFSEEIERNGISYLMYNTSSSSIQGIRTDMANTRIITDSLVVKMRTVNTDRSQTLFYDAVVLLDSSEKALVMYYKVLILHFLLYQEVFYRETSLELYVHGNRLAQAQRHKQALQEYFKTMTGLSFAISFKAI